MWSSRISIRSCGLWSFRAPRGAHNLVQCHATSFRVFSGSSRTVSKAWGHPAEGPTYHAEYPTEFRASLIPSSGRGWWAKVDIPADVRLRRLTIAEGTLLRFSSEDELISSGWDIDDAVNYGIGHHKDPSSIYFGNPGTTVNHADKTREASVKYVHDEEGALEIWTVKDIKAGEEMLCDYALDYAPCPWYDKLQRSRGNVPLSRLDDHLRGVYAKSE